MNSRCLRSTSLLTLISFLCCQTTLYGADPSLESVVSRLRNSVPSAVPTEAPAAEYVLRKYPGEKLIPVRLLGGVNRPGVYFLPEGTDLLTAISLSAGLVSNADEDNIRLSRASGGGKTVWSMEEMLEHPKKLSPILAANDVLFVEEKKPFLSNNTMLLLTAVSSVMGIVVGAVVISRTK